MKNRWRIVGACLALSVGAMLLGACSAQSFYAGARLNSIPKDSLPNYEQYQKERKALEGKAKSE